MPARRDFFRSLLAAPALLGSAGRWAVAGFAASSLAKGSSWAFSSAADRVTAWVALRTKLAEARRAVPAYELGIPRSEAEFPDKIASFTKCLPHDRLGHVSLDAYEAYLKALRSGTHEDFEAIPMGSRGKLISPQSSFSFTVEGGESQCYLIADCPSFSSDVQAADMIEVYWLALTRDVPFSDYSRSPLIAAACEDLSKFTALGGPSIDGAVTPDTVFRGIAPHELTGPYISQFLFKPVGNGTTSFEALYRTTPAGFDYITSYDEWLAIQNGVPPAETFQFDGVRRYIRNGRDLALYLARDYSYQAFLTAALALLAQGASAVPASNPYKGSRTQAGFVDFGGPFVIDAVARVALSALKATWWQKWLVHRRLRPEEFAGRVHNHLTGAREYPLHPDMLRSSVLERVHAQRGNYLLSQAYPEGCPAHPSYPAGHAAIAGACVTVLKALFDEKAILADPVVPTPDGLKLEPYDGALTIGGELNKLASNMSLGRDTAGVHYRTDGWQGMLLGEAVAIDWLMDIIETVPEPYGDLQFTKFDGTPVVLRRRM